MFPNLAIVNGGPTLYSYFLCFWDCFRKSLLFEGGFKKIGAGKFPPYDFGTPKFNIMHQLCYIYICLYILCWNILKSMAQGCLNHWNPGSSPSSVLFGFSKVFPQATRDERSGLRWRGLRSIIEDVVRSGEMGWRKLGNILTNLRKSNVAMENPHVFPPNKAVPPTWRIIPLRNWWVNIVITHLYIGLLQCGAANDS
jgi:hypothetical protein